MKCGVCGKEAIAEIWRVEEIEELHLICSKGLEELLSSPKLLKMWEFRLLEGGEER